jgi:osmotically-inducible protein OsmY
MSDKDEVLARRVRDIVAVVADDIDAVNYDVEDGIVYIEGVVPSEEQRRAIATAVTNLEGVDHLVTCLSTEHIFAPVVEEEDVVLVPPQVYMHYHSLS